MRWYGKGGKARHEHSFALLVPKTTRYWSDLPSPRMPDKTKLMLDTNRVGASPFRTMLCAWCPVRPSHTIVFSNYCRLMPMIPTTSLALVPLLIDSEAKVPNVVDTYNSVRQWVLVGRVAPFRGKWIDTRASRGVTRIPPRKKVLELVASRRQSLLATKNKKKKKKDSSCFLLQQWYCFCAERTRQSALQYHHRQQASHESERVIASSASPKKLKDRNRGAKIWKKIARRAQCSTHHNHKKIVTISRVDTLVLDPTGMVVPFSVTDWCDHLRTLWLTNNLLLSYLLKNPHCLTSGSV